MSVSKPDPHPPSQINKEAKAAVVPKRARCFPLPACSLMTKASCCSCLLRPLLCGSIVDRAPLVYSWTVWGKTFWTATSLSPHSLRISTVCVHQRKRVRVCVSIYTQLWALCTLIGPRTATGLSGNGRHCSSICSSSHCLLTEHNLRHSVTSSNFWGFGALHLLDWICASLLGFCFLVLNWRATRKIYILYMAASQRWTEKRSSN